jgi:uroporphyrinogen III methyltransferase/synthase
MGNTTVGIVYFVGAGPGDPGLITLRGVECLRRADLVLYDYLANPQILKHARPSAELVCLGQPGQEGRVSQEGTHVAMIRAAREGKIVVRLKGGDPDVFGRGAEEIEALTAAGIPYQSVPGVTAALAAAGYAGISVTHGRHSSAVALVTGQERHYKQGESLDYGLLADFPGTLIFYMGTASAKVWSEALLRRGKPPDTPVAIVRRCSWSDQETVRCTLAEVVDVIAARDLKPPAIVIVGHVAGLTPEVSWFTGRPLFGKRIVVTRPRQQNVSLAERLGELGAEVLVQPAIEIAPPQDWTLVDEALDRLDQYQWVVFSSANGVQFFLDRLEQCHGDVRRLGLAKLAAIGPGTAEELAKYRLRADLVPGEYRAEALADALVSHASGEKFLLIRASRGREVLAEQLVAAGKQVEQVVVYQSTDVQRPEPDVAAALAAGKIDWITVTSSAIAQSLVRLFGDDLRRTRLASISPVTSETLIRLGFPPAAEATRYTMDGLVDAILGS